MFELIKTSEPSADDARCWYDVTLDEESKTVGGFIKQALSIPGNRGHIEIKARRNFSYDYQFGDFILPRPAALSALKIKTELQDINAYNIAKVTAFGGYSEMDYTIIVMKDDESI